MGAPDTTIKNRSNAANNRRLPAKSATKRQCAMKEQAQTDSKTICESVIEAAREAGNGSLVAYLRQQAEERPSVFVPLLGKVLSMRGSQQGSDAKGGSVNLDFTVRFVTNSSGKVQPRVGGSESNKKTLA